MGWLTAGLSPCVRLSGFTGSAPELPQCLLLTGNKGWTGAASMCLLRGHSLLALGYHPLQQQVWVAPEPSVLPCPATRGFAFAGRVAKPSCQGLIFRLWRGGLKSLPECSLPPTAGKPAGAREKLRGRATCDPEQCLCFAWLRRLAGPAWETALGDKAAAIVSGSVTLDLAASLNPLVGASSPNGSSMGSASFLWLLAFVRPRCGLVSG